MFNYVKGRGLLKNVRNWFRKLKHKEKLRKLTR